MKFKTAISALALSVMSTHAFANCGNVTFSDVGWTDITATTAATTTMLEALGYETDIKVLSVPVTYVSLAKGDVDVFLGNWMPISLKGKFMVLSRVMMATVSSRA